MCCTDRVLAPVAAAIALFLIMPAAKAAPRTFVSGTGAGTACTRAAPCATFQVAHNATDANGEINCVDAGDYGPVTITKSITIDCAGTLGAMTSGEIVLNAAGVVVRIRNLAVDLVGSSAGAIIVFQGAALYVENCSINNMTTTLSHGISFTPNGASTSKLFVSNTAITHFVGTGIFASPMGSGAVHVVIDKVRSEKNDTGMRSSNEAGPGLVITHIRNSVASGNGIGLLVRGNGGTSSVTVDRSSFTLGSGTAIWAQDPGAFVILGRSTVMSNQTGLLGANGSILSYRNNHLTGNVSDGSLPAVLTVK